MQKNKKHFLGLLGLVLVALMTVVAYFLPAAEAFAEDQTSVTQTIRVTVYDRFPSIKIDGPATDYMTTSSEMEIAFTYENATYVDFTLSYEDEDGNIQEVALPRFNPDPSSLDPTFNFASGSDTITINLDDYNLGYGHYIISAVSTSPIGPSTGDAIEFDHVPSKIDQTGTESATNDPIIEVDYDDGVAKIEIMPVDKDGNPLFDEPIVIEVPEPYEAGSEIVVLPFTENGIDSGDYDVIITTYRVGVAPEEEDYVVIPTPLDRFTISYTQPAAPDVPNTGRITNGGLNIAKSDYIITAVIAFAGIAVVAFLLIGRKKKDYRKSVRSRK